MARVVVKMFKERDCAMCGKPFMPTCSNMKTCDPGCGIALSKLTAARRKESKRQSTKKQCVVCGDVFIPEDRRVKTCSPMCHGRNRRASNAKHDKEVRHRYGIIAPPLPASLSTAPQDINAPVRHERDEFSEHQVRAYFGLDQKEPKKYVAKSLAECEAMKGKTG